MNNQNSENKENMVKTETQSKESAQPKKIKSSEAFYRIKKAPVKKRKKKKTLKEKIISFISDFNNYKLILGTIILGIIFILAGLKIHIGNIEDNNSLLIGAIVRSVLIAVGSGIIVAGIFQQRRKW